MSRFLTQLGVTGSILGALGGLIELTVGAQIRPWIGNKENPAVLGIVTLLLSGMALGAILFARKLKTPTNDGKLAIFLGVWLPAMICFTTVGRLWYLPGLLLTVTALLLARKFWFGAGPARPAGTVANIGRAGRWVAVAGSLLILGSEFVNLSVVSLAANGYCGNILVARRPDHDTNQANRRKQVSARP